MLKSMMHHAASMTNPPKGYGSLDKGLEVIGYRSERLAYWAKEIGNGRYTDQVFINTEKDVVERFGNPK